MAIIDDFEDQDITEYARDPGDATVQNGTVLEGSWTLQIDSGTLSRSGIVSTTGLDAYPSTDTPFRALIEPDVLESTSTDSYVGMGWFVQSEEASQPDGYYARITQNDDLRLVKVSGGSESLLDSDPLADILSNYAEFELEVSHGSDGSITATLYDDDNDDGTYDAEVASVSATDTEFSTGGIAWEASSDESFSGQTGWYDYAREVIQEVTLATTSQDADQASAPLNRTRTLGATTQDADRAAATLQRARTLSLHVQDADQGAAALGLAWSLAVTSQDAEQAAAALQRSRALASTSQDADQASAALNRFRALSTTGQDADQSLVALDLAGIVALALNSQDADQASTALQRARTLALTAQDADASAVTVNRARTLSSLSQDADQVDFALDFGFRVTDAVSLNGEFNPTIRLTGEFNPQERLKGDWIVVRLTGVFDPDEGLAGNLDTPWSDEQ